MEHRWLSSMEVYRITKDPYHSNSLSVIGSHRHGGRWTPKGVGILYTSRSPELALLETLVHLPPLTLSELPQLWLSTIRLPNEANNVFWVNPNQLPSCWKTGTLGETQTILTEWLQEPFCLAIAVPPVILEVSYNLLLHPQHASFADIEIIRQSPI